MTRLFTILLVIFTLSATAQDIELEALASGFNDPTDIQNAGDDRLFIVEQGGLIKIVNPDGSVLSTPFLDLSSAVSTGGERGLLGLAFHPDFQSNGYFYVDYTDTDGNTVISRFTIDGSNPNLAIPDSETVLLTVDQPFSNHNGGCLAFGPDEKLYIGMGDGGSGGDPNDNAQNLNTYLGKILRLDVDMPSPYIPADNPFANTDGAKGEIWLYGLRNPWKFSFDNQTGNLWIGDVGQGNIEEINRLTNTGGQNLGWRCYEGDTPYDQSGDCPDQSELTFPLVQYTHSDSGLPKCSITGGYVYRGSEYQNLQGLYIFADYCSDEIGTVDSSGTITYYGPFDGNNFTGFGQDSDKNLYVAGKQSGTIYKVTDANLATDRENKVSLTVSPNPTSTFITLRSNVKLTKAILFSIDGKEIKSFTLSSRQEKINFDDFPTGLYLLKITSENSNHVVKTIVKN